MARGGKRSGAGRKIGFVSEVKKAVIERSRLAANEGETPLEVMLAIMRKSTNDEDKLKAAMAAAPYVHPRLAAVEHKGDKENPVAFQIVSGVPRSEDQHSESEVVNGTHAGHH